MSPIASPNPSALASVLDTQRVYSSDGTMLLDEYGPQHTVKLADGSSVSARRHTHITYDEGAPATGGPFRLPTTTTLGAYVGGSDADVRRTRTEYDWTLRKPTAQIVDPGGLNLRTTTIYNASTGLVLETRLPANPAGGDAHATATVYYTAAANPFYPQCGGKPWWANLPCQTRPVAQPASTGAPPLPVTTYTYDRLSALLTRTDTAGSATRTTTYGYDAAGRLTGESVTSSEGLALPAVSYAYDPATGRLRSTSTASGTIWRFYDDLGRMSTYTDADANTATTTYDLRGRVAARSDAKGSQSFGYDPSTGDMTTLQDSALGTIQASYNADGQLAAQTLPNGLSARSTYDETGDRTRLTYVKTTGCASNCTVYDDTATSSIHSQWLARTSTAVDQRYAYDAAARLTQVSDTRGGQCTVRDYAYDADSNRIRLIHHDPAFLTGGCTPTSTGTTTSYTYDAADRLISGEVYDIFGRTTSVPAANAGGTVMTGTYYANDLVASVTQGTTSQSYTLDPARRVRTTATSNTTTGFLGLGSTTTTATATSHYDHDSDSPAWLTEDASGMTWTRNITGVDSDLIATQTHTGAITAQIANLHGDLIATATTDSPAMASAIREPTEFGIPADTSSNARYQWLGGKERATALPTGAILMGQRVFNPYTGRFLQVDPVRGGSANPYDYVQQDPLNLVDLDGRAAPAILGMLIAAKKGLDACIKLKKSFFTRAVGKACEDFALRRFKRLVAKLVGTKLATAMLTCSSALPRNTPDVVRSVAHMVCG